MSVPQRQREAEPQASTRLRKAARKRQLLQVSNKLAIIGTTCLAVAIAGSVALVTSLLFGNTWAAGAAALVAGLIAVVWFVLPFVSRLLGAPPGERSRR